MKVALWDDVLVAFSCKGRGICPSCGIADAWTERTMSLAEWAALDEDEPGELVDGRTVAEESVGYAHEVLVGRYTHTLAVTEGSLESVPGCDGLILDVDALWRELDRLIAQGGEGEKDEG